MLNSVARLTLSTAGGTSGATELARLLSQRGAKVWRLRLPIFATEVFGLMLGWLLVFTAIGQSVAAEPAMRLRLKDGSFSEGTMVGASQGHRIGWHNELFEQPFEFDVRSIRSLTRMVDSAGERDSVAEQPLAASNSPDANPPQQVIEMVGGGALVGTLIGMDDTWLTVASPTLGAVQVSRSLVIAISDADYSGQVVYSGPLDESHWQRLGDTSDWDFEAGVLVARRPGAAIVGDVQLPAQSQINLALSWSGTPDFVLSLGTFPTNRVSRVEEVPSAARLEVWANQLALVREVDGGADIAMLAELNSVNPRIELSLYLDQQAGSIVACDAHGRPLETLQVAGSDPKVRTAVHLANSGPSLTIERFEVRQWDGVIATVAEAGEQFLLDSSGQRTDAGIAGFDAESRELRIVLADGGEQRLPLDQLRRGSVSHAAIPGADNPAVADPDGIVADSVAKDKKVNPAGEVGKTADLPEEPPAGADVVQPVELVLMDRTRLKGHPLASVDAGALQFEAIGVNGVLQIPIAAVRGVIGNAQRYIAEVTEQPLGTLKSEQQQLSGYLEPVSDGSSHGSLALRWHPQASLTASPLRPSAVGSIAYRAPLPQPVVTTTEKASQPMQVIAPAIGMFLGRRPAAANGDQAQATGGGDANEDGKGAAGKSAQPREILFRTGDAVDGVVEQIDDSGMRFRSQQTDTQFVPHNLIEHVWLNRMSGERVTSPEKLKRLMTVPRSMKQDPPTHLFIAVNGDYLRGRLVSLQDDKLTVEIRLEMVELQASTIAQIVWLHDRDWEKSESTIPGDAAVVDKADGTLDKPEAGSANAAGPFLVHAIGRNERGLTFFPESFSGGQLSGVSELLGQCSIAVENINQLLFGPDVTQQVRAYRDDPWTLSLAQLPRVYLDDGSDLLADKLGDPSPLVGQVAADFSLQSLTGDNFRLSDHRERVVVLDFWASWCGPCVQTMPLVEQAVADMGSENVQLVAINIQEPATRVQAAVDRLQMSSTVLLDAEGQVAAAYQASAIPQTVIIDRAGNVTHVFVGGGARFVAHFKQALETVVAMPDAEPPVNAVEQ